MVVHGRYYIIIIILKFRCPASGDTHTDTLPREMSLTKKCGRDELIIMIIKQTGVTTVSHDAAVL